MSNPPKELILMIQPRVIDHLGIKMYQKPVDVIAEYVANAWDADAEQVNIVIDESDVSIIDNGNGMSFDECQNCYLTVGRNRRKETAKEFSEHKHRPVLGRKGIGKFAGFGVAKQIVVDTVSVQTGEHVAFKMDIDAILNDDASGKVNKAIEVLSYESADTARCDKQGTKIVLAQWNTALPNPDSLKKELSRRFLLSQSQGDFAILVNGEAIPDSFSEDLEFVFPQGLTDEEKRQYFPGLTISTDGWANVKIDQYPVKWRIGFFEHPIDVEELRGVSVFAKGKMAQKPFFFDLKGGISGQTALEYITGQVQMDFIDEDKNDLIATERQRINLQTPLGQTIQTWGIELLKKLSRVWATKRSEAKIAMIESKTAAFSDRLDKAGIDWRACAENIDCGYRDPFHALDGWYNSQAGHRETLLSTKYANLGVGFAYGANSEYQYYGTQDFYTGW